MKLSENAEEINERSYGIHEQAQFNMGTKQRRQGEIFNRKVNGEPLEEGNLVWLFRPHKAKSRKFYLPWHGYLGVRSRTIGVTYMICKRGNEGKVAEGLKTYQVYPELRQSVRGSNRHTPTNDENPTIEPEEDSEDRHFLVSKPMTAESQEARTKPKVTFR